MGKLERSAPHDFSRISRPYTDKIVHGWLSSPETENSNLRKKTLKQKIVKISSMHYINMKI
jgi:hypothetical protein